MKFIIGKKINMTQVWNGDNVVAVTKIKAGPCVAVQIKTDEKDSYKSVQLGFGSKKEKNIKKPQKGHFKNLGNFRYLKEFRISNEPIKRGNVISVNTFNIGDKVKITGITKGRGFQGVVKRYNFKGTKKTHGNKDQLRMPGSIGATGPAHVFKGQRMPGRMGNKRVTIKNLEIIDVNEEENILLVKGAIPGPKNGLVLISGEGELKVLEKQNKNEEQDKSKEQEKEKLENKEEVKNEEENIEDKNKQEIEKNNTEDKKDKNKKQEVEKEKTEDNKKEAQNNK